MAGVTAGISGYAVVTPTSRAGRLARISEIIATHSVTSQGQLADMLADTGIHVSQGTLSRDLVELGAQRVRNINGDLVYALADNDAGFNHDLVIARLAKATSELLTTASGSANLAVLKTPAGAAQYFASLIDRVAHPQILGTIAGDATVMVISATDDGGKALADWFLTLGGNND